MLGVLTLLTLISAALIGLFINPTCAVMFVLFVLLMFLAAL